ncbi:exodeoxyribonuclease VII small subunit, partial [uncultured Allobaculum sp.]
VQKTTAIPAPLDAQGQPMSFQKAMKRLEEIVNQLNDPNLDLETALVLYKEGLQISQFCSQQLDQFQMEMNQLSAQANRGDVHEA